VLAFRGGSIDVADQMEDCYKSGACDRFMDKPAMVPAGQDNPRNSPAPTWKAR
jgi:hypothetical protein